MRIFTKAKVLKETELGKQLMVTFYDAKVDHANVSSSIPGRFFLQIERAEEKALASAGHFLAADWLINSFFTAESVCEGNEDGNEDGKCLSQ